jgi:hypothetical protein
MAMLARSVVRTASLNRSLGVTAAFGARGLSSLTGKIDQFAADVAEHLPACVLPLRLLAAG